MTNKELKTIFAWKTAAGVATDFKCTEIQIRLQKNTIYDQLKNSKKKVPNGMPYVVCIDLSGPRFDINEYSRYIHNHFEMRDHPSFSGVLLVEHGLIQNGNYFIQLQLLGKKYNETPIHISGREK